jgi:hypothetical protein
MLKQLTEAGQALSRQLSETTSPIFSIAFLLLE